MLLGLSGKENDQAVDMGAIVGRGDSGLKAGAELVALVDAIAGLEGTDLAASREAVTKALGVEAMVDAVAVAANFFMMTRIADSTGTPLDEGSVDMSAGLRQEIGVDDFVSRRHVG